MNKKGFTLVELLAVIAILAILVIIAMPNVMGMFNQAKSSSFQTEVQSIMDAASTKFMTEALTAQGESLIFKTGGKELDLSGGEKKYFIQMSRDGEIVEMMVMDKNFCYAYAYSSTPVEKTDVEITDIKKVATTDALPTTEEKGSSNSVNCTGEALE